MQYAPKPADAPYCPTCGYNLTGLAAQGICPECGQAYDTQVWAIYSPRPFLGYGSLLIVPTFGLVGWYVILFTALPGVCCVLPAVIIVGGVYAARLAERLAAWTASRERVRMGLDPGYSPEKRTAELRPFFFIMQMALLVLSFIPFVVSLQILKGMGFSIGGP